jgi:hypothetical protein
VRLIDLSNKDIQLDTINITNLRTIDALGYLSPVDSISDLISIQSSILLPSQNQPSLHTFSVGSLSVVKISDIILNTDIDTSNTPIISATAAYVIVALVSVCTVFFTIMIIVVCISSTISSGGTVNPVAHMNDDVPQDDTLSTNS